MSTPQPPAEPVPPASPPGMITPPPWLTERPEVTPPPEPPVASDVSPAQPWAPLGPSDDLDRTVVVSRPSVAPWHLVVEGGPTWRLTGTRVVLGRRPHGAGAGAQEIAIPDTTRTLSKVHARLELFDGAWTVTDLDATNGVIVVGADGTENLLDPGASARLTERFVLGRVAMRLVAGDGVA